MPSTPRKSRRTPDPAAPAKPTAIRVLRQFRIVFNAIKAHFQQVEKRAGVGGAHVWALSVVRQQPGIGVGELARRLDIHQSTASNLVRSLVERGLLAAERGEVDRRAVQLRVLPEGSKVLRKVPAPFSGLLPEALSTLDDAVLERMARDLEALISQLQAVDTRAARKPLAHM